MHEKTKDQWVSQGIAYLQQRQPEKALVACLYARQIDPNYSRAHHGLGIIFDQLGLHVDAQASYEKALQLDPNNPKLNRDLADYLYKRKKYNKSGEYYRKARELDPKYDHDYQEKLRACSGEVALQLAPDDPDPELKYSIANKFYERAQYKLSGEVYRKIIHLDSKYNTDYMNKIEKLLKLGNSLENSERYTDAINMYKKALSFAPDNQSIRSIITACEAKKPVIRDTFSYSNATYRFGGIHTADCKCVECYEF